MKIKKPSTIIKKVYTHINTSVNYLDIIKSKISKKNKKKIKVGWCSLFPPSLNGVASANYFIFNDLSKWKEVELYAIPFGGRIDKKLFPKLKIAKIGSSYLDVVVFFGIGKYLNKVMNKTKAKKIIWQTLHEPLFDNGKFNNQEMKIFKDSNKGDMLIGMSKWSVNEYKQQGAKNVAYVPHTVDTNLFNQKKLTKKKKDKQFTVLFVSRIHYYKGIMPFLDSIPYVIKKHPEVVFKLHAPLDKNSNHLKEINTALNEIKNKYPKNFLIVTKWIDYTKLNEVYQGSDVLVFPSCNEGFGIPLIEAMSKGIPCIVANKPPMNEIVINNETGFCINFRKDIEKKYHGFKFPHPEDIAKKIIFLIEDKKKYNDFRDNCITHVNKNYKMQQGIDELIMNIKKVLNKGHK